MLNQQSNSDYTKLFVGNGVVPSLNLSPREEQSEENERDDVNLPTDENKFVSCSSGYGERKQETTRHENEIVHNEQDEVESMVSFPSPPTKVDVPVSPNSLIDFPAPLDSDRSFRPTVQETVHVDEDDLGRLSEICLDQSQDSDVELEFPRSPEVRDVAPGEVLHEADQQPLLQLNNDCGNSEYVSPGPSPRRSLPHTSRRRTLSPGPMVDLNIPKIEKQCWPAPDLKSPPSRQRSPRDMNPSKVSNPMLSRKFSPSPKVKSRSPSPVKPATVSNNTNAVSSQQPVVSTKKEKSVKALTARITKPITETWATVMKRQAAARRTPQLASRQGTNTPQIATPGRMSRMGKAEPSKVKISSSPRSPPQKMFVGNFVNQHVSQRETIPTPQLLTARSSIQVQHLVSNPPQAQIGGSYLPKSMNKAVARRRVPAFLRS